MMKLYFELENTQGEKRPFTYQLGTGPTVQKFERVTREALTKLGNFPHGLSFGFRPNEHDLSQRVERMNHLIDLINREGQVTIAGPLVPASELTQERLNFLHLKFHEYEEREASSPSFTVTAKSLRELNILIHQIEQNRASLNAPVFTQYLIFLLQKTIDTPMDEADHLNKTLELHHGDLMLGYCTVGKSLFHCYKDNDIELVRSKMVRDQVTINTEVVCAFPQIDDDALKAKAEVERFHQWCERHQVQDFGYDYRLPLHRPGNVCLGKLIESYSYSEITDIFRHFQKMVCFELR